MNNTWCWQNNWTQITKNKTQTMETFNSEKLSSYRLNNQKIVTGFATYADAERYAEKFSGKVVEIAFRDGNDNPEITDDGGLIEKKTAFFCRRRTGVQICTLFRPRFQALC